MTLPEYLVLEAVSPDRRKYRDGQAVVLPLPTRNHALVTGQFAVTFGAKALSNGCRFFGETRKWFLPTETA